ncbi:GNAT family N-acetyltransferase [Salinibacillus xinjiangensis]|uniref:GNAT family N-acetyltransferase n=1 Tax=Salinibacillus xinjiangensis TaxID=1229268 RepID=A0A6G1X4W1_9BACI|nr:GNAT family N-acetyltransferase [Salinibacillus xinjiangensis]MRG85868.1 GNAT family N-acetyltransferase [Salinibacillus xinjiangensis]
MNTLTIKEMMSREEVLQAYPVMKQLRAHLDESQYVELVEEAQQKEGYKMFALFDEDDIVAVIGFHPMVTLYYGRFIWVCDLVTDQHQRSKGYGEKLLNYVHNWGDNNGFESVALSSGLKRKEAHRFYEDKMDYDKVSYVFKHELD